MGERLFITRNGSDRVAVIKTIREITGCSLSDAKAALDTVRDLGEVEVNVLGKMWSMDRAVEWLRDAGATVEVRAFSSNTLALTDAERAVIDAARDYSSLTDCKYIPSAHDVFFSIREKLRLRLEAAVDALARTQEPPQ